MPNNLGNPPSKTHCSTSRVSIEITSLLRPSPEPTTTLSGIVPGRALLDTPEPNEQETTEPEPSQRRVLILTERGSGYADIRKAFHKRSAQIRRTKARNARRSQETSEPRTPCEPSKPCKTRKTRKTCKSPAVDSASYLSDAYSACSTVGTTVTDMSTVRGCGHNPGPDELCDCSTAANAGAAGGAGRGGRSGAGNAATGGGSGGRSGSRSPPPIPGTPGQDPEPEHSDIVKGIDPTSQESQYTDFVESLDPTMLVAALRKYIHYDPATLSTQDLKSILTLYVTDNTPAVASAKRKAKALESSQKTSTNVDDDQSGIDEPRPGRPTKRAHMVIEDDNTDTVDESEIEKTESESEPNTEPLTPPNEAPSSNHPSRSPSPLPCAHVPIDPNILDTLDLPFRRLSRETLDTTQAPTQEYTSYLTRPLTRPLTHPLTRTSTTVTEVSPAQCLPAQPLSVGNRLSTSLASTGPSQRPRTQLLSVQATIRPTHPVPALPDLSPIHQPRPLAPPSTSAAPPRAPRNTETSHNRAESSRRKDKACDLVRRQPVDGKTLRQAAELAQFIQDLAKQAQIEDDVDPPESRTEQLEKDLVCDDKEERSTRAAEEAGEFP
ncbi:hypothetical protein FRC06_006602, partial [Ceratobasidium sp. 370]